jgi:hypothetical protein
MRPSISRSSKSLTTCSITVLAALSTRVIGNVFRTNYFALGIYNQRNVVTGNFFESCKKGIILAGRYNNITGNILTQSPAPGGGADWNGSDRITMNILSTAQGNLVSNNNLIGNVPNTAARIRINGVATAANNAQITLASGTNTISFNK